MSLIRRSHTVITKLLRDNGIMAGEEEEIDIGIQNY